MFLSSALQFICLFVRERGRERDLGLVRDSEEEKKYAIEVSKLTEGLRKREMRRCQFKK